MGVVLLQTAGRMIATAAVAGAFGIANAAATRAHFTSRCNNRDDKALKVWLQNLLDSPLIAFMWGFSRCWSVRVD
jgi:hypothetical protein